MKRGEKCAPEYSVFEEQAKNLERRAEDLRKKGKQILEKMREIQSEVRDYREIENHYLTPVDLRDRMRIAQEKSRRLIDELGKDMEMVRAESAMIVANIGHLRQQDAAWDAFVRNEEENGPFLEA